MPLPFSTIAGTYGLFGLTVSSQIALPEAPIASLGPPDVEIGYGAVAADGPGFVFTAPDVRFCVTDGRQVVVDAGPDLLQSDLRLYLLGTVMGLICHQRGLLPLHAATILVDGQAVAFAGPSGVGKSTLSAHCQALGYAVFADDLSVLDLPAAGAPIVQPGVARAKLWVDSLEILGLQADGLAPLAPGVEKFALPLAGLTGQGGAPLRRLFVIDPERGADHVPERLTGIAAAEAVLANVYRWSLARDMAMTDKVFALSMAVAKSVDVYGMGRMMGLPDRQDLERLLG